MNLNAIFTIISIIAALQILVESAPSLETSKTESSTNLVEETLDSKVSVEARTEDGSTDRNREAKSESDIDLDLDAMSSKNVDPDIVSNNILVVRGRTIQSAMDDVYAITFVLLDTLRSNLRSRNMFPFFTRVLDTVIQRFFPPNQGYEYVS